MYDVETLLGFALSIEHASTRNDHRELCRRCKDLPLNVLFESLPEHEPTDEGATQRLTQERTILISPEVLSDAHDAECTLCKLLITCAVLSGLPERYQRPPHSSDSRSEQNRGESSAGLLGSWRSFDGKIYCSLRPRLAWKTSASEPTLEHSGEIDVGFYEKIHDRKPARREGGNSVRLMPTILESPLASWSIDVAFASEEDFDPRRAPIEQSTNIRLVRDWLHECNRDHNHDSQVAGISQPLSDLPVRKYLRGIDTTTGEVSTLRPGESFVALSYIWGRQAVSHTELDARRRAGPITLADYPPTIRDAAILSSRLGYRWLWVDRVCIDQRDDSERARLIPHMKDIFAAAELTIVAACGDGAHSGLPGVGETEREPERWFDLKYGEQGERVCRLLPRRVSFNALLEGSAWRTRGWTFEEHVFSRRLLYVFPSEVFFSCARGTFREATGEAFSAQSAGSTWGDRGRVPPTIAGELHGKFHGATAARSGNEITAREFVRAVEEYSARELTIEEDRIQAFAGLVAAASGTLEAVEMAPLLRHGHPLRFFETLLTWHHEEGHVRRRLTKDGGFAPSWSWASGRTKLYFLDNGEEHIRSHWFKYSSLHGFDILGVPVERDIPIISGLELLFPDDLLSEAPWEWEFLDMPPTYESLEDHNNLPSDAQSLPQLHLLTVVFDAMLEPASDGQYRMRPLNGDSSVNVIGRWSLDEDVPADDDESMPAPRSSDGDGIDANKGKGIDKQGQSFTFALVGGGNNHLYIMLLRQESKRNTFSRSGVFKQAFLSGSAKSMRVIMARGAPSWKYICIA